MADRPTDRWFSVENGISRVGGVDLRETLERGRRGTRLECANYHMVGGWTDTRERIMKDRPTDRDTVWQQTSGEDNELVARWSPAGGARGSIYLGQTYFPT